MDNLSYLVDNSRTDKNTTHSYLPLYETLLYKKKQSCKNILEIGICDGGSIKLWRDYFTNSKIFGVDTLHINKMWNKILNDNNIILYTSTDAYTETFVKTNFIDKNIKFDVMLDDGPHTLISMIKFIQLYLNLLSEDGILIIEDIQSIDWINELKNSVPDDMKKFINIYDLRHIKNRYDDIVFTIDKSK
jgi:hypothetical protein